MLKSGLYHYSNAYILVSVKITVAALGVWRENNNIQVVFKTVLYLLIA